jgi:hypothetical protein
MLYFLLKFTLVSNSALLFWKLLVSEFLLGISDFGSFSFCSSSKSCPSARDVHQLLMLSARTLTYFHSGTLSSVIFYNIIIINDN